MRIQREHDGLTEERRRIELYHHTKEVREDSKDRESTLGGRYEDERIDEEGEGDLSISPGRGIDVECG